MHSCKACHLQQVGHGDGEPAMNHELRVKFYINLSSFRNTPPCKENKLKKPGRFLIPKNE